MAWTDPSNPVASTVITVAYAVANFLTQIRWLRTMTGGADPAASNQVVVSSSTSATAWGQVPTDAIADLAVTNAKIALATIDLSTRAAAGSLTGAKVASATLNLHTVAVAGSLVSADIADNSIDLSTKAAAGSLTGAKTANKTIAQGNIALLAIGTPELIDASVTAAKLAAGAAAPPLSALAARGTSLTLTSSYQDIPGATVTATATGTYIVLASAHFDTKTPDGVNRCKVQVNGSDLPGIELDGSIGITQANQPSGFTTASINSGQVVKLQAKKDSGANSSAVYDAYLAIFRIA